MRIFAALISDKVATCGITTDAGVCHLGAIVISSTQA